MCCLYNTFHTSKMILKRECFEGLLCYVISNAPILKMSIFDTELQS